MPYESVTELPLPVREHLPRRAQEIFMEAFNEAYRRYRGDEVRAFKIAWTAVKRAGFRKNPETGRWEPGLLR